MIYADIVLPFIPISPGNKCPFPSCDGEPIVWPLIIGLLLICFVVALWGGEHEN